MTPNIYRLVSAYRTVASVYNQEFIDTPVVISGIAENTLRSGMTDFNFYMTPRLHGRGEWSESGLVINQMTCGDTIYSQYYASRHGNKELMQLMLPILTAKLVPALMDALVDIRAKPLHDNYSGPL